MTRFGRFLEKSNKGLVKEVVVEVLADAGINKNLIEAAYMGNAAAGAMTGQHMIRGQVTLEVMGIAQIYEIVKQLRGDAGDRQVGHPKVGLMHNGGGILGVDAAAMALHVFKR